MLLIGLAGSSTISGFWDMFGRVLEKLRICDEATSSRQDGVTEPDSKHLHR